MLQYNKTGNPFSVCVLNMMRFFLPQDVLNALPLPPSVENVTVRGDQGPSRAPYFRNCGPLCRAYKRSKAAVEINWCRLVTVNWTWNRCMVLKQEVDILGGQHVTRIIWDAPKSIHATQDHPFNHSEERSIRDSSESRPSRLPSECLLYPSKLTVCKYTQYLHYSHSEMSSQEIIPCHYSSEWKNPFGCHYVPVTQIQWTLLDYQTQISEVPSW